MDTVNQPVAQRRCETDVCDIDGNCTHCGSLNGEVCRDPNPVLDRNVLMFVPKWPRAGTFGGDGGSAA